MIELINGDCLEEMKKIPDGSIDLVLTDPPYGLEFMGKDWDKGVPGVHFWVEMLRVLKPGGYLLSFGGTRTYHRMASAIEDGGFEVRDMIEWVYGCLSEDTEILTKDGWKMLYSIFEGDYIFACDYTNDMKIQLEPVKQKFIYDYDEEAYHIKDTGYYNSELMKTDHIVSKNHNVLVSESWATNNSSYPDKVFAEKLYQIVKYRKTKQINSDFHIPGLNGFIPCTIEKIHYKGKVWCVEVESGAFVARRKGKIFITGNSGFPKSLNIGKVTDKFLKTGNASWNGTGDSSNGALGYSKLQHKQDYRPEDYSNRHQNKDEITEEKAKQWEGWGTALKPAHEPICMARKPLAEKTVAENVLKYGTGGINVDGSRVGTEVRENPQYGNGGDLLAISKGVEQKLDGTKETVSGRFPANLIHDNSEEVRECFPDSKSPAKRQTNSWFPSGEANGVDGEAEGYGDSGNAARFYKSIIYQAKASKSERNKGCDGLEEKQTMGGGGMNNTEDDVCGKYGSIKAPAKNHHPTVKPVALMEYLTNMCSKEGAVVLDPFMGSGTTGVACKNLNRNFIGMELDREYFEIAKKRIYGLNL